MEEIIKTYENHPSIKLIKDNVLSEDKDFTTELVTVVEINNIIKDLNSKLPDLMRVRLRLWN